MPKDIFNEIVERLKEIESKDPGLKRTIKKSIDDYIKGENLPDPIKTKHIKNSGPKKGA
jgi:hypothetical protein